MSWIGVLGEILSGLGGLTAEVRRCAVALEAQVDADRQRQGLPPLFGGVAAEPTMAPASDAVGKALLPGEFQKIWEIQQLCLEQRVPFDTETDLEQVALDRGWITPEGTMLVRPEWDGVNG